MAGTTVESLLWLWFYIFLTKTQTNITEGWRLFGKSICQKQAPLLSRTLAEEFRNCVPLLRSGSSIADRTDVEDVVIGPAKKSSTAETSQKGPRQTCCHWQKVGSEQDVNGEDAKSEDVDGERVVNCKNVNSKQVVLDSKDANRGDAMGDDAASNQVVKCEDVVDSKEANIGDGTGDDAVSDNANSEHVVNCEGVDDSKDAIAQRTCHGR